MVTHYSEDPKQECGDMKEEQTSGWTWIRVHRAQCCCGESWARELVADPSRAGENKDNKEKQGRRAGNRVLDEVGRPGGAVLN